MFSEKKTMKRIIENEVNRREVWDRINDLTSKVDAITVLLGIGFQKDGYNFKAIQGKQK